MPVTTARSRATSATGVRVTAFCISRLRGSASNSLRSCCTWSWVNACVMRGVVLALGCGLVPACTGPHDPRPQASGTAAGHAQVNAVVRSMGVLCNHGGVTDTLLAPPAAAAEEHRTVRHVNLAILALAIGGFGIGTSEFVTMALLPQIADGVGISIPAAGHVVSAYALGVVVGAPLIAIFGAKLPRRALLVGLMAAYALFNVLSAAASSYGVLFAARFLDGLPHGAYFGVASLVAASLAAPERRGRAVASVMLGLSVANVVGVPAATWLGQQLGWRSAYLSAAGLALLTV